MTSIDSYHTRMVAPEKEYNEYNFPCYTVKSWSEQPISTPETGRFDASGVGLPVTEQEEEAWIEKLKQLAGCVA
jgi:hypothetical protein